MRVGELRRRRPGRHQPVEPQAPRRPVARPLRRQELAEPRHRRLELRRRRLQPRRHPVPAAPPDQPLARQPRHRGAEVDPGAPTAPSPCPRRRRSRSPPPAARRPPSAAPPRSRRRRDASPRPAAQTSGPSAPAPPPAPRPRPHAASISRRSAFSRMQPRRQRRRLVRVVGGEEPRPEVGHADPPAGVHPRPEHEAERRRCSAAPGSPADLGQRHEPRPLAPRHHRQPLPHQRPVEPGERRHVRHRGERDEVERARAGPAPPTPSARISRLTATSIRNTTPAAQR